MLLKIDNLTLNNTSIKDLCFQLKEEDTIGVFGPTGTGKSSLLNYIADILPEDLSVQAGTKEIGENAKISYVFQQPNLLDNLTVFQNLYLPIKKIYSKEDAETKIQKLSKNLFLEEKLNLYPKELSGGERQRVCLARALLFPGKILLLDEPFSSQDEEKKNCLIQLVKKIQKEEKIGIILVSHNKEDLQAFSTLFTIKL